MRHELKSNQRFQIGEYWLSRKHRSYCRTWFDKIQRQTRRESLGTEDCDEAKLMLAAWVTENVRPQNAAPQDIQVDQVFLYYWNDWEKNRASAGTLQGELFVWHEWWTGKTVADVTPENLRLFRESLIVPGRKNSTIDKYLAVGRAAFNFAERNGMILTAPRIRGIETTEEKEARPPMGRPLKLDEMATFIDSIRHFHLLIFTLILLNTSARSSAIVELERRQYDSEHKVVALNPEGRVQTKKRRPSLLVPANLQPWLDLPMGPRERYVTWEGKPVRLIVSAWETTLQRSGLQGNVNRYSFRHGMSRLLRSRGIHLDEIGMGLGHKHRGANATTAIYAPDDPTHLERWAAAVDDIVREIKARLKTVNIESPQDAFASLSRICNPIGTGRGLKAPRAELDAMILSGQKTRHIADRFRVSFTVIYKRKKELGLKDTPACRVRAAKRSSEN